MLRLLLSVVMCAILGVQPGHAQFKKILGGKSGANSADSGKGGALNKIAGVFSGKSSLSSDEVAKGLKEALRIGAEQSGQKLSKPDAFFQNSAIKILMPPEAVRVEKQLRSVGLGKQVDDAILSMNRAAEDAAMAAVPIFVAAIRDMTISDAMGILKGGDRAATDFLRDRTTKELTKAFRPPIETSLEKVQATRYWNTVFTNYNKFSREKINPDLPAFVTEKALEGLFYQVGKEEEQIRKDPMARTTELLRKVFGNEK